MKNIIGTNNAIPETMETKSLSDQEYMAALLRVEKLVSKRRKTNQEFIEMETLFQQIQKYERSENPSIK